MAFVRHHRSIASVHSSATSYCASPCRAQTSSQYTSPVESGSRSPETAATPTSSSSARPSATSPSRMRSRAAATRPTAHAAASHAEPTSMARSAHCRAPSTSPVSIRSYVRTTASQACAGVSCLTLEQAFRPGEPAAHRCHQRGVQEQVHRDANRCARRRDGVAGLDAQRVRALPRLDGHVEMAGRVGDLARATADRPGPGARPSRPPRAARSPPPNLRAPPLLARAARLIARRRNREGYSRIGIAHAYGLRTPSPQPTRRTPWRA